MGNVPGRNNDNASTQASKQNTPTMMTNTTPAPAALFVLNLCAECICACSNARMSIPREQTIEKLCA